MSLPWYHAGLPFTCTQCGDCCTGAPGFVWVNEAELRAIAAAAGIPVEEFEEQFVRHVGLRRSLIERENGDCVMLDPTTRKCTVYDQRPRQCRTWPFWDSNLESPETWARTCAVCPGSGEGRVHSLTDIEAQRKVMHV